MPSSKKTSTKYSSTMSEKADSEHQMSGTGYQLPVQKQFLLEWESPTRPYKKLDKEIFSTILAGAFLLGVILFFIDGAIPVLALSALVFLFYVMGTVPPSKITHTITTWGIESEDKLWPWELMTRYWMHGEKSNRMLVVEVMGRWSRHLRFMLDGVDEIKLTEILQNHMVQDQPKPNWLDKASKWLENRIRLAPEN